MRSSGRTLQEELTVSKFQSPILNFWRGCPGTGVWSPRGQTGFIVGSGLLDGTIDEDK